MQSSSEGLRVEVGTAGAVLRIDEGGVGAEAGTSPLTRPVEPRRTRGRAVDPSMRSVPGYSAWRADQR